MENKEQEYERQSQRDYTMGFKLQVVSQVEKGEMTYKQAQKHYGIQGRSTVLVWLRKHGNLDWSNPSRLKFMSKSEETPAQKIKRLEKELKEEKMKAEILNLMIDISDKQYGTQIRKKFAPKPSTASDKDEFILFKPNNFVN